MKPIDIDRNMAHVILQALAIASVEGMSSLVENNATLKDKPEYPAYAEAEHKLLQTIDKQYPDVVSQYFDVNKQI
jgi:hypothetical protein